jgi:hypothetical protein
MIFQNDRVKIVASEFRVLKRVTERIFRITK